MIFYDENDKQLKLLEEKLEKLKTKKGLNNLHISKDRSGKCVNNENENPSKIYQLFFPLTEQEILSESLRMELYENLKLVGYNSFVEPVITEDGLMVSYYLQENETPYIYYSGMDEED
jgi:hypothetical protein